MVNEYLESNKIKESSKISVSELSNGQPMEPASVNLHLNNTTQSQVLPSVSAVSSAVVPAVKTRRSRSELSARRWAWLRGRGSYLDYMQYYGFLGVGEVKDKLANCQHTWLREHKQEAVRWRGIGCGERHFCPVCGSYSQLVISQEASESMLRAMTALEVSQGLRPEGYGLKLVLTLPKDISAMIDKLLYDGNYQQWDKYTGQLFHLAYKFIERWFGVGTGGVASMDYSGESSPGEPNYHLNVYVFPARRGSTGRLGSLPGTRGVIGGQHWTLLEHWVEPEKITAMRVDWTARLNKMFDVSLEVSDFKVQYLGEAGNLHHWTRYLYRHPLADLWRGWQGVEGETVQYKATKRSAVMSLSADDIGVLVNRLEVIPSHFKRVRWFGIFADGVRGETFEALGLEASEVDIEGDSGWVRDGDSARFQRFASDGVVLAMQLKDSKGDYIWQEVTRPDGSVIMHPVLGDEFTVSSLQTDYRPSGVSTGKRKRWREPGGG